jgi:hypothetical protein
MKRLNSVICGRKIGFLLLLLFIESCSARAKKIQQQEIQAELKKAAIEKEAEKALELHNQAYNDSLIQCLRTDYPLAFKLDTVSDKLTFFFQALLKQSSYQVLIEDAAIRDIEMFKGNYIIHVSAYDPYTIGYFKLPASRSKLILAELGDEDSYEHVSLVVKVNKLVSPKTIAVQIDDFSLYPEEEESVTEIDIQDYVHIDLSSESRVYYMSGEVLDYFVRK